MEATTRRAGASGRAGGRSPARLVAVVVIALGLLAAGCGGDDSSAASEPEPAPTSTTAPEDATVLRASGDIAPTVEEYRALLGPDNGKGPGTYDTGSRQIKWDGVPDEFARPNGYPADFFNAAQAPRARGITLVSPSGELGVSARAGNPSGATVRFGDVNATYTDEFTAFSEERLFSPIGSNVVDATFTVPGTHTPGAVRGFGAVYTGVDTADSADFEFFDAAGESLGRYAVPVSANGVSFLGVAFDDPIVARVHIVYGNSALGPDDSEAYDVAVMDDFIYGEPQPLDATGGNPGGTAAPTARTGTFVGGVGGGTDALVAVIADGEKLAGYVCDGDGVSRWFAAEPLDAEGTAALVGRDGTALGTVTFAADGTLAGSVELDGVSGSFTLDTATGAAGLYRAEARRGGELALEAGWIVLGDGTQTGAANLVDQGTVTVGPAPRLDTSAPRVAIRGFGSLAADHLTAGFTEKIVF